MELMEGIYTRRSVRRFTEEPVSRDLIRQAAAAAAYAPSWKNTQTARWHIVTAPETLGRIAKEAVLGFAFNAKTIQESPALVILTSVKNRSGFERDGSFSTDKGTHWESFDAGCAAQTFCLAVHSAGLGTVILGVFDEPAVRAIVPLPDTERISALIALGHPAEVPAAPARKDLSDLMYFED